MNADIAPNAAISYSKINLALGIVNGDISASAAIALAKLASSSAGYVVRADNSGVASWMDAAFYRQTATITEHTTTTETDWLGDAGTGITVTAGELTTNSSLTIKVTGTRTVNASSAPTSRFRVYAGGSVVLDSGAASTFSTSNGAPITVPISLKITLSMLGNFTTAALDWDLKMPDTGIVSNQITTGDGSATATSAKRYHWIVPALSGVDFSASQAIRVTHQWGTSNADNSNSILAAEVVVV